MKVYVGGAYQGQAALAEAENPGAEIIDAFHARVRELLADGGDAAAFARRLIAEKPDAVIVCDEIGAGIVPLEAEDRAWREATGRAMCLLCQSADAVTRVCCGIGVRIK
jgi:adenosyl cobinamide kinase/adenosyl cobinamide phosphate guanylyltransferase